MKARSYAPAAVAIVGLFVVYRFVSNNKDDAPKPTAAQVESKAAASAATAPTLPSAKQPLAPSQPPQQPGVAPTQEPHPVTADELKEHEPKSKLPKMNESEKVAAAREHITVMDRRVELLEKEIAELDAKGEKAKADEQRVIVKRIKEHAEKMKKDIAEGREPE